MIKEIIVKEKIIPQHKKIVTITTCDFCNNEAIKKCEKCGRDICKSHYIGEYDRFSDYLTQYCFKCHELFENKYKKDFEKIDNDYEKKLDNLITKIMQESLQESNNER